MSHVLLLGLVLSPALTFGQSREPVRIVGEVAPTPGPGGLGENWAGRAWVGGLAVLVGVPSLVFGWRRWARGTPAPVALEHVASSLGLTRGEAALVGKLAAVAGFGEPAVLLMARGAFEQAGRVAWSRLNRAERQRLSALSDKLGWGALTAQPARVVEVKPSKDADRTRPPDGAQAELALRQRAGPKPAA